MGAAKFMVLVGGLVGVVSFFLPLVSMSTLGATAAISAFQFIKGIEKPSEIVKIEGVSAEEMDKTATGGDIQGSSTDDAMKKFKMVIGACFAPSLLLLIIGGVAVARKQFGRLGGTGAFLFGLIGLAAWALLNAATSEVAENVKGIGMHLLLVAGALGLIGGVLALIKPERPSGYRA